MAGIDDDQHLLSHLSMYNIPRRKGVLMSIWMGVITSKTPPLHLYSKGAERIFSYRRGNREKGNRCFGTRERERETVEIGAISRFDGDGWRRGEFWVGLFLVKRMGLGRKWRYGWGLGLCFCLFVFLVAGFVAGVF